jgi:hypothetical protein
MNIREELDNVESMIIVIKNNLKFLKHRIDEILPSKSDTPVDRALLSKESLHYSMEWAEWVVLVNKHKSISECFVEPQNINECVRFTQRIKAEYSDASDSDSFISI